MAWALSHPRAQHASSTGMVQTTPRATVQWPRGLAVIGFIGLLVSAWGAIVPFLGPAIGYHANGTSAWHWSLMHACLYLAPGVVAFAASLGILGRAQGGRTLTRFSLGLLGLVVVACGAWFVVGPTAWPTIGSAVVFTGGHSALNQLGIVVGYNLGVGVVLSMLGGMAMKAGIGERLIVAGDPVEPQGVDTLPAP